MPGTVIHTMGYPLRTEEFGGGVHLRDAGRPDLGRLRQRLSTTAIRCSIRTSRFSASSSIRSSPILRRREDGALRRQGAARGRLAHACRASTCRRRAHRRRRRRLHELDAAQGHPPRDAHRHAGRRDGVRAVRAGDTSAAALQAYETPIDASACGASSIRCATSIRLRARPARRPGVLRAVARDRRLVVQGSDARARRPRAHARSSRTTTATRGPIRCRSIPRRSIAS